MYCGLRMSSFGSEQTGIAEQGDVFSFFDFLDENWVTIS